MARRKKEEIERLKKHAKQLFLDINDTSSIDERALRVGVSVKTFRKWINEEGWEKLKTSLATSKSQALKDFYEELEAINNLIKDRPEGERYASFKEAQQRRQLIKDIKAFETKTSIAEIYEVGTKFLDYVKSQNVDLFKQILPFYDGFLKDNID